MSAIAAVARWFGFVPVREARRAYAAAKTGRLFSDWIQSGLPAYEEVKAGLKTIRERSQEQERDNDYVKRFLALIERNVIGSTGLRLQMKSGDWVTGKDGKPLFRLDTMANDILERQWKLWGKKGVCTVDGRKSWLDAQKMFIRGVARDGEALVRMVRDYDNGFRFALQFIDPAQLDTDLNVDNYSGNKIRLGIEIDQWTRPVAYWVLSDHPGASVFRGRRYQRISAEEIVHGFLEDREGQTRGIPWLHTAIRRLKMVGAYEEAELIAARVSACKMGFYIPGERYVGDDADSSGNPIQEADPGHFEQLPTGMDFTTFDPQHPAANFAAFIKATLRGISAGLGVSYNKLANDLEGVNYTSLREGNMDDRDGWMVLQEWTREHLCEPVFAAWLDTLLLTELTPLPYSKLEKFHADTWQGRRWHMVDPDKDTKGYERAVRNGWRSDAEIAGQFGNDREDMYRDAAHDKELSERYDVVFERSDGENLAEGTTTDDGQTADD